MKKKEMMKEQKRLKEARNEKFLDFSDSNDVKKIIYIAVGVVLFIGLFFVIMNLVNGTWFNYKRQNPIPQIDTKLLMCGTIFNRTDSEYLVLAYNVNDENDIVYASLFESYTGSLPLYYLDLESGFNKGCVGEKSNFVNDSTKIIFSSQTLLHIKDDKIIKSYTGKDQIKKYLIEEK